MIIDLFGFCKPNRVISRCWVLLAAVCLSAWHSAIKDSWHKQQCRHTSQKLKGHLRMPFGSKLMLSACLILGKLQDGKMCILIQYQNVIQNIILAWGSSKLEKYCSSWTDTHILLEQKRKLRHYLLRLSMRKPVASHPDEMRTCSQERQQQTGCIRWPVYMQKSGPTGAEFWCLSHCECRRLTPVTICFLFISKTRTWEPGVFGGTIDLVIEEHESF